MSPASVVTGAMVVGTGGVGVLVAGQPTTIDGEVVGAGSSSPLHAASVISVTAVITATNSVASCARGCQRSAPGVMLG